jgi:hypothetical protein
VGQVIAFPIQPTSYPDLAADLDTADCVLLIAVRWWVEAYRIGADPIPRLCEGLEAAGAHDAAFSIDGLMTDVSRVARRPVDVRCSRCPNVSDDEKHLLHAASLAQACDSALAEKVLRTTLLSAEGAAFAVRSLDGLGELFAEARLFLSRRTSPALDTEADPEADDGRESWSPPAIH